MLCECVILFCVCLYMCGFCVYVSFRLVILYVLYFYVYASSYEYVFCICVFLLYLYLIHLTKENKFIILKTQPEYLWSITRLYDISKSKLLLSLFPSPLFPSPPPIPPSVSVIMKPHCSAHYVSRSIHNRYRDWWRGKEREGRGEGGREKEGWE